MRTILVIAALAHGAHAAPVGWKPNMQLCANATDCDNWAAAHDNTYRAQRGNLDLIVNRYNSMLSSLLAVERPHHAHDSFG